MSFNFILIIYTFDNIKMVSWYDFIFRFLKLKTRIIRPYVKRNYLIFLCNLLVCPVLKYYTFLCFHIFITDDLHLNCIIDIVFAVCMYSLFILAIQVFK